MDGPHTLSEDGPQISLPVSVLLVSFPFSVAKFQNLSIGILGRVGGNLETSTQDRRGFSNTPLRVTGTKTGRAH